MCDICPKDILRTFSDSDIITLWLLFCFDWFLMLWFILDCPRMEFLNKLR